VIRSQSLRMTCLECWWQGTYADVLTSWNPFDPIEPIEGCPKCRCINGPMQVCDVQDCWEPISCGTPTLTGYRQTCGKHMPRELEKP
jgi:hypothetical protein